MAKDAKTRAKAQALYEAGQSTADIAQKLHLGLRTVKGWCKSEGWQKGKSAPKLHQAQEDAALRAAEKAGLSLEGLFQGVATLLNAKDRKGKTNLDALDKGLTHARHTYPGFKVVDKIDATSGGRSLLDEVIDEA